LSVSSLLLPVVSFIQRSRRRGETLIAESGIRGLSVSGLLMISLTAGLAVFVILAGISQSVVVAAIFSAMAMGAPFLVVHGRAVHARTALREVWPDVVDNLASSVRAGLALPQALAQLGVQGPVQLRPQFEGFARAYEATGRFGQCLDQLKDELADPVADRIIEALRVARDVGGNDLGRLLRTLSVFLREDARIRGELQARQSWTINGARLAVSSPWLLLLFLSLRPQAVAAYDTPAGLLVLSIGAGLCVVAYQVMMRIAVLPSEPRVLQ
ncbi:MAG: type II secretion system protein F, partial [actinobacterium acAMD-2]